MTNVWSKNNENPVKLIKTHIYVLFTTLNVGLLRFFFFDFSASVPEFGPQNPAPERSFYEFEVTTCGFLHPEAKI